MDDEPDLPWYQVWLTVFSYIIILAFSYGADFWATLTRSSSMFSHRKGYAPIFSDFEAFWTRRVYRRIKDCWDRPVGGVPADWIELNERYTPDYGFTFVSTGKKQRCLNLGSYNYLGFSGVENNPTLEKVQESIKQYGLSMTSSRSEVGTTKIHRDIEIRMSKFLGKEDCIIFGQGFSTNHSTLPAILGKGSLIISDSLNHASIVTGARSSSAKVKVFAHNDPKALEAVVRKAVVQGQPRTHLPWTKILIVVEGIYSMEGEICPLKEIIEIKKKYKCYLWVDEAHSIGALGPDGRGVCDHAGVPPEDVDILMGTFTKSYASVGGYVCGSSDLIAALRQSTYATLYSSSLAPGAAQQVLSSIEIIMGDDGTDMGVKKIASLRENSNFFRNGLIERGFQIMGDKNSPVIPLMLYHPSKIAEFSREALKRNIAVVVVGFPATPLLMSRARFCISAGHTRKDLEWALNEISEIGDKLLLKYGNESYR
eukprot:TRINITY_DN11050_c0_g1_i1.p1 TRINITY_DN11050_c0_g1~~TRINITY_DN11050_c0_g1_i1.p1  ORF type:complete len:483 (+),score=136.75 TRINITY_DN11050_c0_g1_i1:116-1564(+)